MTKGHNLKKHTDKSEHNDIDNINDHINLLVLFANQLDDKNNIFKNTDDKLNNYVIMMQDVLENYYNFCIEKI
jgi:hypothetical protein